jgi:iron complex transport system substrate-binding protein
MLHRSALRSFAPVVGAALAAAALAACGSSSSSTTSASSASATTTQTTAAAAAPSHYPVTVSNCGTPLTFDSAPTRAVSNDINTTEDMLALGLEHSMVGTFGVTGDGPVNQPVPTQYEAGFKEVRDVSSNYFTLEPLVGLRPDFLFAGWNYGLQVGTPLTPARLGKFGIKTLALDESCAVVEPSRKSVSVDETYTDLANLGAIFDVPQRASAVIKQMKAQIAAVQQKVAGLKPVTVFDYDSGNPPVTGPGLSMLTPLVALAGGTNIFASLKESWTNVSWEQVVKAQPQCIIINDYGTPTWQQKLKFLRSFPASRDLPAVRNNCIIHLAYDEVTPSPRNAEAVLAIAKLLHPTAFGLPARVS